MRSFGCLSDFERNHTASLHGGADVTAFTRISRGGFGSLSPNYNPADDCVTYRMPSRYSNTGSERSSITSDTFSFRWRIWCDWSLPPLSKMWWQERSVVSPHCREWESPAYQTTAKTTWRNSNANAYALLTNSICCMVFLKKKMQSALSLYSQHRHEYAVADKQGGEKGGFLQGVRDNSQLSPLAPTHNYMHKTGECSLGGHWTLIKQGGRNTCRCGLHLVSQTLAHPCCSHTGM